MDISDTSQQTTPIKMRLWEQQVAVLAGQMYQQLFPNHVVNRSNCRSGSMNQFNDIDLEMINLTNHQVTTISEKFHGKAYKYFLLEITDSHHKNGQGWGMYGNADLLYYMEPDAYMNGVYVPGLLRIIKTSELRIIRCMLMDAYGQQFMDVVNNVKPSITLPNGVIIKKLVSDVVHNSVVFLIPWDFLERNYCRVKTYVITNELNSYLKSSPFNRK